MVAQGLQSALVPLTHGFDYLNSATGKYFTSVVGEVTSTMFTSFFIAIA